MTADEIAERLGMKTEWVWAQARAGRIPHVRLGRYRRFRESAVEEWLRELETGGTGRPSSPQSRPIRCAAAHRHRRAPDGLRTRPSAAPQRSGDAAEKAAHRPASKPQMLQARQQIDGQLMDTLGCPGAPPD